ncbi:hypothetical protein [Penaeicola halotolerans]|uniref:hypothetical protein n=1 Tax=Penaeicola halotolerans TaxID=2793196 RepID=UPI001CF89FE0|nr:hypothetical protein [Penaeicola halotolerans]
MSFHSYQHILKITLITCFTILCFSIRTQAQTENPLPITQTENVWRVNFLNPSLTYEKAMSPKTTLEGSLGFGYNASYPDLAFFSESGFQYILAVFVDVQSRYYYNLDKRKAKGKTYSQNAGNYLALRMLYTGPDVASSFIRFDNNSFAVGPTWGIQRHYGRFNLNYSMGPIYYFNTSGSANWVPFYFEINLGFNLSKPKQ